MTEFELCKELNLHGFPQKRKDDAWYYLRPDMLILMRDSEMLRDESKNMIHVSECIYRPTTDDFIEYLGTDLQNIVQTVRSGWFAYTNSTLGEGVTTRSGGDTPWLALANVVLARYLEKNQQIPVQDPTENSENVHEAEEPPIIN